MFTTISTNTASFNAVKVWYRELKNKDYEIKIVGSALAGLLMLMRFVCKNVWKKISIEPLDS